MEALYLLCSAVSTFLISSILSILLPFNALLRYFSPAVTDAIRLYHGHVRHVRRRPVPHAFGYPVRYALVDLDRPSDAPLPLSFFRSHMSADEVRRVTGTTGPV